MLTGKALFVSAKCSAYYLPQLRAGALADGPTKTARQSITPYTDFAAARQTWALA